MGAVLLLARGGVRRSGAALMGLALIVAVAGTVILAALAGARRTASAYERASERIAARDVAIQVDAGGPVLERVRRGLEASPDVEAVAAVQIFPVGADSELDMALYGDPEGVTGVELDRPLSLVGRLPAPDADDEVALNPLASEVLDLQVGDVFRAPTFSPDDVRALIAENRFLGFNGPEVELRVTGVGTRIDELQGGPTLGPGGLVGPAFLAAHETDVGGLPRFDLRLTDGREGIDAVADQARELAGPDVDVSVETTADAYGDSITRAIDVLTTGLVVFSVVAAAAGLLIIGQAVARQTAGADVDGQVLRALGVGRTGRVLALGLPTLAALLLGATAAGVGSVLASPLFPIGLAGEVEVDRGIRADPAVALLGAMALIVAAGGYGFWRARGIPAAGTEARSRPSVVLSTGRRLGVPTVPALGTRLALEPGRGRTATPVRSALVGATVGVLGVVAVGVVVTSLDRLVAEPVRWGWTWSATPDVETTQDLDPLADDDRVAAAALLSIAQVQFGGAQMDGYAISNRRGETSLTLLGGRLPTASDEVVLGARTADELEVGIGDEIPAQDTNGGQGVILRVVGEAVLPIIDNGVPGDGALFTPDGLDSVRASDGFDTLLLTYPEGADPETLEHELSRDYGLVFSYFSGPNLPGDVANLHAVRPLLTALAAFFVVVAVVGLAHALAVSTRRRRVDFAVLRAMGLRRREVRRSVAVQAVVIAVVGLAVGVPAGIVAGRISWKLIVGDVGVVDDAIQPLALLVVLIPAAVAVAVLVAAGPAWQAAARRPGQILRAE